MLAVPAMHSAAVATQLLMQRRETLFNRYRSTPVQQYVADAECLHKSVPASVLQAASSTPENICIEV
jgi:hypothetical protein